MQDHSLGGWKYQGGCRWFRENLSLLLPLLGNPGPGAPRPCSWGTVLAPVPSAYTEETEQEGPRPPWAQEVGTDSDILGTPEG